MLRSTILSIASELPVGDPTRRKLLRLADKANTPAGAKKLHKQYLDGLKNPSESSKRPKDFYDKEEGDSPEYQAEDQKEEDAAMAKKEKSKSKSEKGEEKQRRQSPKKKKERDKTLRDKGFAKGKAKAEAMPDKDLEAAVSKIIKDRGDPNEDPDDLLGDVKKLMSNKYYRPGEVKDDYRTPAHRKKEEIERASDLALLSQYAKRKGKGSKKANLRSAVLRIASDLPKGDPTRRRLLRLAGTYTEKEWKTHTQEHPGAKAENHTITKGDGDGGGSDAGDSGGSDSSDPVSAVKGIDGKGTTKATQDALALIKDEGVTSATTKAVGKALRSLTKEINEAASELPQMRSWAKKNPGEWADNVKNAEARLDKLSETRDALEDFKSAVQGQEDKAKSDAKAEKDKAKSDAKAEKDKAKSDAKAEKDKSKKEKADAAETERTRLEGSTPAETKANKAADKVIQGFKSHPRGLAMGAQTRRLLLQVPKASPKMRDEIIKQTEERATLYNEAKDREGLTDGQKAFWTDIAVLATQSAKLMKGSETDWGLDSPAAGQMQFLDPVRHKALTREKKLKDKADAKAEKAKKKANLRSAVLRIASDLPKGDPIRRNLLRMAQDASYEGNPDGDPIYPGSMDHGYDQALSGGHDIMKRVVDNLRIEQGSDPRDPNPRLAGGFLWDAGWHLRTLMNHSDRPYLDARDGAMLQRLNKKRRQGLTEDEMEALADIAAFIAHQGSYGEMKAAGEHAQEIRQDYKADYRKYLEEQREQSRLASRISDPHLARRKQ